MGKVTHEPIHDLQIHTLEISRDRQCTEIRHTFEYLKIVCVQRVIRTSSMLANTFEFAFLPR